LVNFDAVGSRSGSAFPIQIQIRIHDGQLIAYQDLDPQQLNMVISHGWCRKPEEKEKSLFEHFLKGLSLYMEARIRIRIRIK
jgi:hypothetical protein